MRGIGAGQKIHVFIIPEVQELMHRELSNSIAPPAQQQQPDAVTPRAASAAVRAEAKGLPSDRVLEDVVAWLVINSLRSEQTQWTMLCIQNIGNLYRKNAFQCLRKFTRHFLEGKIGTVAIQEDGGIEGGEAVASSPRDDFVSRLDKVASLQVSIVLTASPKSVAGCSAF